MVRIRFAAIVVASLGLVLAVPPPALAQQPRQGKVFTNDDVARPAPEAPTAESPAKTDEAPAAATPSSESAAAAPAAAEQPSAPPELNLAQSFQGVLRRYMAGFSEKLDAETDPVRQERWRTMMNLTMSLMAQNQQYISELESAAQSSSP